MLSTCVPSSRELDRRVSRQTHDNTVGQKMDDPLHASIGFVQKNDAYRESHAERMHGMAWTQPQSGSRMQATAT